MPRRPNRRVCVFTGSRILPSRWNARVCSTLDPLIAARALILVGCAAGLDGMVRKYLNKLSYPCTVFVADWGKHGKAAGPKRNGEMIDHAVELAIENDCRIECFAFPLSVSPGTRGCMRLAREAGAIIYEIERK